MENNDTNLDYTKFARVGDQKWEIVEITIGITFLLEISIYYFLYREFSSPTWKKSPPPKVPIPTQNPNLTWVPPIKTFWKMDQPLPNHLGGGEGGRCKLSATVIFVYSANII